MKKLILFLVALACAAAGPAPLPQRPNLVVAIAVDQFRYDYLTRFRTEYTGGLNQLLAHGAVFTSATYQHYPTVTAVGHSTFLTGAIPSISGIIGNEWYDRDEGKVVTSVSDDSVRLVGGAGGPGSSPRRLLVSTVGDELKIAGNGKPRVIGISFKDRSAILPSGHMADGAYWFDARSGNFVSSSFYFPELPAWVKDFNAGRPADHYRGAAWLNHKIPDVPEKAYAALAASPFGNELIEALAERAIRSEQLGKRGVTDVLAVSFSSNDYIGHQYGPDSPEVHDISVRTDRLFAKLFAFLDSQVGMDHVLLVMTADHGVAPVPEVEAGRRMPGGRFPVRSVQDAVEGALQKKYGAGPWIASAIDNGFYFNLGLIASKGLDRAEVDRTAAEAARLVPRVFRVYTREQLMNGPAGDPVDRRVRNGFAARRSADIDVLLDPYWMVSPAGTTHGSPFGYDTHVPLIFLGAGIRSGRYFEPVTVNDVAPTLAAILEVETPSGSVGRVLSEMF